MRSLHNGKLIVYLYANSLLNFQRKKWCSSASRSKIQIVSFSFKAPLLNQGFKKTEDVVKVGSTSEFPAHWLRSADVIEVRCTYHTRLTFSQFQSLLIHRLKKLMSLRNVAGRIFKLRNCERVGRVCTRTLNNDVPTEPINVWSKKLISPISQKYLEGPFNPLNKGRRPLPNFWPDRPFHKF